MFRPLVCADSLVLFNSAPVPLWLGRRYKSYRRISIAKTCKYRSQYSVYRSTETVEHNFQPACDLRRAGPEAPDLGQGVAGRSFHRYSWRTGIGAGDTCEDKHRGGHHPKG